jgi:CHAD domain-containing protein
MTVVEKALSDLRKQLENTEKNADIEDLHQLMVRLRSLEQVKRELSLGLGGRTIIR